MEFELGVWVLSVCHVKMRRTSPLVLSAARYIGASTFLNSTSSGQPIHHELLAATL